MEDRFKFRFYDKKCKIMIYDLLIQLTSRPKSLDSILNEDNEYISVMQCTGLKDRNGKLIYEGDILKNDVNYLIQEVVWQHKQAEFSLKHKTEETIERGTCYLGSLWMIDIHNLGYEIIGNIYENKELLDASI